MSGIAVLGAGMAAGGALSRLGAEGAAATVYERRDRVGGHTTSTRTASGFVFDEGPHISFTTDERIQERFAANVGGDYEILRAGVNNHWRGHWIKHPAQCNLYGLPTDLVVEVLRDFVAAQHAPEPVIDSYADWLLASYGATFAETFPMEYGRKYHTTEAANMSTDWLGPRLYRPDIDEILRGALTPDTADVHYVDHFRYPSRGGFEAYVTPLFDGADVRLGHEIVRIDAAAGRLHFAGGAVAEHDGIVSSLPLPVLVDLLDDTPAAVVDAASRLAATTCVVVDIGITRDDVSDAHWTYFYDDDFFLTRLSYPHLFSPGNVPPGHGSFQAEVYYSGKYRPLDRSPADCIEPVIADLRRCGLLRDDDEIVHRQARVIPYANVIFDRDRSGALATVNDHLDELGIARCGRYGEWGYHWTDESFISGEAAAQQLLDAGRA